MSARRTKASRRAAFRAYLDRTTEPAREVYPPPFGDRCYGWRCFGSGWMECWCGLCGEEQCFGCPDCRDRERDVDEVEYDNDDWGDPEALAAFADAMGAP